METARQQQMELGLMRDQLVAVQRDRDEALAPLNNVRQNGQPPAPVQQLPQQHQPVYRQNEHPHMPAQQVQQQFQIPNNEVCNIISVMGF